MVDTDRIRNKHMRIESSDLCEYCTTMEDEIATVIWPCDAIQLAGELDTARKENERLREEIRELKIELKETHRYAGTYDAG